MAKFRLTDGICNLRLVFDPNSPVEIWEKDMPGGKKPGPSIKRPKQYEALKRQGKSKESAAKISNASAKKAKRKRKK